MSDASQHRADFESHHIEGHAAAAADAGLDSYFKVDLISEIAPNLWMGGCIDDVGLGPEFSYVLSLYPWERYRLAPNTRRLEVRLYDSADVPDVTQLYELAELVNRERAQGRVLVHCQAGLNRSGLVTALSLIVSGMTPGDAVALLREKRCPLVLCNQAFLSWVLDQGTRAA